MKWISKKDKVEIAKIEKEVSDRHPFYNQEFAQLSKLHPICAGFIKKCLWIDDSEYQHDIVDYDELSP